MRYVRDTNWRKKKIRTTRATLNSKIGEEKQKQFRDRGLRFEFDVHAGRQIEVHERVHRLR